MKTSQKEARCWIVIDWGKITNGYYASNGKIVDCVLAHNQPSEFKKYEEHSSYEVLWVDVISHPDVCNGRWFTTGLLYDTMLDIWRRFPSICNGNPIED